MIIVEKNLGETPLECLERTRLDQGIAKDAPMTYAGRLDPLASGKLLMLVGEECKDKEKYLGLDKEYEIEVLFGVKTDTGDALGLVVGTDVAPHALSKGFCEEFIGRFEQEYPAYSSKTFNGKQLHTLARSGELPDEMPTKEVEIYSIEDLGSREASGSEIAKVSIENVSKVNGDFRQKEIIEGWNAFAKEYGEVSFTALKLRVKCSSGTYMRALAERMGGMAIGIRRTRIGAL